jgi:hypothetical protein
MEQVSFSNRAATNFRAVNMKLHPPRRRAQIPGANR